jgi:hypothetical protein
LRISKCGNRFVTAVLALYALGSAAAGQSAQTPASLAELLNKLSSAPADACEFPQTDFSQLEFRLFQQADNAVEQVLNATSGPGSSGASPRTVAIGALQKLERLSADANRVWPDDKRFHFDVLDLPPAVLVKMTFRNRATFSFFANFRNPDEQNPVIRWHFVGALDDHSVRPGDGYDTLDLYPLTEGPSRNPRFLAVFGQAGCGSGLGVSYYAYEWNAGSAGRLEELIKLEGAVSQFDAAEARENPPKDPEDAFFPVGKLETRTALISLPYCWLSAVDTWDNPSLCAVNSYDLSGRRVRFTGTIVNRPDLLPVAKAIESAEARDYPAVLAYCASADVAQRMVRDVPPFLSAVVGLKIVRISPTRKRIEFYAEPAVRFEVEKRGDRWLVVGFRTE